MKKDTRPGTKKRFTEEQELRLIRAAIRFGESLMPCDCADIIARRYRAGTLAKIGLRELARTVQMMMEASSFFCNRRDALEASVYLV